MGRIIKPIEVQMQVGGMVAALERDREQLQEVLPIISDFSQEKELQGKAWTGMKEQLLAHRTVIRGCICMAEELMQEGRKLVMLCGLEELNEDELKLQIQEIEQIREKYKEAICTYQNRLRDNTYEKTMGWYARSQIKTYEQLIELTNEKIRILHRKLTNIDRIDRATRNLTDSLRQLMQNVKLGIQYLENSWDGSGFLPAGRRNMAWMSELNGVWEKRINSSKGSATEFVNTISAEYGFDKETGKIMYKLYSRMEKEYGEEASQRFFAMMASFCYGGTQSLKQGILWGIIGNIDPIGMLGKEDFIKFGITEDEYYHLRYEVIMQHHFCEANSIADIKRLIWKDLRVGEKNEIKELLKNEMKEKYGLDFKELPMKIKTEIYNNIYSYSNKTDFAHMAATTATILNKSPEKNLGNLAGIYNGIFSVDGNAGYVGDVYGTNGAKPSMGNEDYKADLDAVNIAYRIQKGISLDVSILEYYREINGEKTNRAREFLINIGDGNKQAGKEKIYMEAKKFYDMLENSKLEEEEKEFRKEMVQKFVNSIFYEKNNLE